MIRNNQYDLLIIDLNINYGELAGIQLIKALKSKNIPILVLSSHKDSIHILDALKSGACDYSTKPIKQENFLFEIKSIIGVGERVKEIKNKNVQENDSVAFNHYELLTTYISMDYLVFESPYKMKPGTKVNLNGLFLKDLLNVDFLPKQLVDGSWKENNKYFFKISMSNIQEKYKDSLKRYLYRNCI